MNTLNEDDVASRLALLEKQQRRLRAVTALGLTAIGMILIIGQSRPSRTTGKQASPESTEGDAPVLVAERMILVDKQRNVRIALGVSPEDNNAYMLFTDPNGSRRAGPRVT